MKTYKLLLTALILGLLSSITFAQSLQLDEASKAIIEGTSNIHDWDADVPDITGEIMAGKKFLKKSLPKVGDALESVTISFKVKTIDGGKGATMNNKIYAAFNETEHPEITFTSTEPIAVKSVDKTTETYELTAKGNLSMAGVTKPVTLEVKGARTENGAYSFTASHTIDMTEFEIKPPSAMFNQIRTGKEVTIKFELVARK